MATATAEATTLEHLDARVEELERALRAASARIASGALEGSIHDPALIEAHASAQLWDAQLKLLRPRLERLRREEAESQRWAMERRLREAEEQRIEREKRATAAATTWLAAKLEDRPVRERDLLAAAEDDGVDVAALYRACEALGVTHVAPYGSGGRLASRDVHWDAHFGPLAVGFGRLAR